MVVVGKQETILEGERDEQPSIYNVFEGDGVQFRPETAVGSTNTARVIYRHITASNYRARTTVAEGKTPTP